MATTVIQAFNDFQKNTVNLDSQETEIAIKSRDWLVEQVHSFPIKEASFPLLYSEKDIYFGSFARKTKKRPLDDIDIMIGLHGQGCTYYEVGTEIHITVPDQASTLVELRHENSTELNSRKVINKFVALLKTVSQYESAQINRRQEAATLKMLSYEWNFDIVPCFFTAEDAFGRTYYIIPDGNGNWKKTDPRVDHDRITRVSGKHGGNVRNAIRIMKFWNRRPTMPSMSSYMFENMLLDYYETCSGTASQYVDLEIPNLLAYVSNAIYNPVYDPKSIQGDLNDLSNDDKKDISNRCAQDYYKAIEARKLEGAEEYEKSIKKWTEIFGPEFPEFG